MVNQNLPPAADEIDGNALLGANDFSGAARAFKEALADDSSCRRSWHGLALTYAANGQTSLFIKTIDEACLKFSGDLTFALNVYLGLILWPYGYEAVEALARNLPDNHPAQVLATYYAGCAALVRNDIDEAFDQFMVFRNALTAQKDMFPVTTDENMNIMFRQALLIERPEIVRQIEFAGEDSFPVYAPDLRFDGQPHHPQHPETPIIISCCNGVYFQQFATTFVNSIVEHCPHAIVHIHVAEPDADTLMIIDRIRACHPTLRLNHSIETGTPYSGSVYFAANRFLLAERFLDFYQSAITIFDIDGELNQDPAPLLGSITPSDIACFSSGRFEPASVYPAAFVYLAHSPPAIRFTKLLRRFILMKLDLPVGISWMLDQAALFSVIHFLTAAAPELCFTDIKKTKGLTLTDYFTPYENPEVKLELMRRGSAKAT